MTGWVDRAADGMRWMGCRRSGLMVDFRVVGRRLLQVRVPIQVVL